MIPQTKTEGNPYWHDAHFSDTNVAGTRAPDWERALWPYKKQIKRVLEVGSYEGQSALFWHRFFGANVDCIDNWENALQPPTEFGRRMAMEAEARFDANTAGMPIRKIKQHSTMGLSLLSGGYDLVYVDGDHHRDQVMIDSCLAWRLLRPGGIIIWDDYSDYEPDTPDNRRPQRAIELFVQLQTTLAIRVFHDTGQQLFALKV